MTHHIIATLTSIALLATFVFGLHAFTSNLSSASHSSLEASAESAWHEFEASHE